MPFCLLSCVPFFLNQISSCWVAELIYFKVKLFYMRVVMGCTCRRKLSTYFRLLWCLLKTPRLNPIWERAIVGHLWKWCLGLATEILETTFLTLHRASLLSWFVDFSATIGTKVSNENVGFPSLHVVFWCNHKDFAMIHAYLFKTNLRIEEDD